MATAFRDLSWTERRKFLGDKAEVAYERDRRARGVRFTDYGLRRAPFNGAEMDQLDGTIKHGPDYIESWQRRLRFVEVQGVGNEGIVCLKDDKLAVLVAEARLPVVLWLWHDPSQRFACLPISQVGPMVLAARLDGQRGVFDEHKRNPKPYTWIPWDTLTANAATHRVASTDRARTLGARMDRRPR